MTTFTFDGVSSTTVPELEVLRVRRPLAGARRDEYVDVPGRAGFYLFEEQPGARKIELELDIGAGTLAARRTAVRAVADLLDRPGLSKLVVDDEPAIFHRCRLASTPDPEEWLLGATFVVELVAEPYGYGTTVSTEAWTATSAVAHTWTPPDTVDAELELELVANGGTVTALTVLVNGETLVYALGSTGLAAGQRLTISGISYTVTLGASIDTDLDGTFDPDDLDMAFTSGDFGDVIAGLNSITITRTGTAATVGVTARWRRRYR